MSVAYLMTLEIVEAHLGLFGRELQAQLVLDLESMSNKIWKLEISQVRSQGYVNPVIPKVTTQN